VTGVVTRVAARPDAEIPDAGHCADIGRDPATITRSIHLGVSDDQPGITRDAISEALDAGFRHFTLGLPARPYPATVARWVADELIVPSL
jgi:hypothetical protein